MKTILSTAAAALLVGMGAAHAADPFDRGSTKDPIVNRVANEAPTMNWSGLYLQAQGGYGNANHNLSVHDYFEDYCTLKGMQQIPGFDPFGNGKVLTRDKLNTGKLETDPNFLTSCEEKRGPGNPPVPAVSGLETVKGSERELGDIDGVNSHGFFGGARIGYDQQIGSRIVAGIYGEYNFSGMETTASIAGVGAFDIQKDDEWSIGARLGYIVAPRTLAYILAAYTQTEYTVGGLNNPLLAKNFDQRSGGATFDGISVGGGIEFALTQNVFFGLEYQHTFYGEETLVDFYSTKGNVGVRIDDDLDEDKVMATLKIKLNSGLNRSGFFGD